MALEHVKVLALAFTMVPIILAFGAQGIKQIFKDIGILFKQMKAGAFGNRHAFAGVSDDIAEDMIRGVDADDIDSTIHFRKMHKDVDSKVGKSDNSDGGEREVLDDLFGDEFFDSNNKKISFNQINKEIQKGNAPKGIERVDKGSQSVIKEQPHIHFESGAALNINGRWKEGYTVLTRSQIEWLKKNGWQVPE